MVAHLVSVYLWFQKYKLTRNIFGLPGWMLIHPWLLPGGLHLNRTRLDGMLIHPWLLPGGLHLNRTGCARRTFQGLKEAVSVLRVFSVKWSTAPGALLYLLGYWTENKITYLKRFFNRLGLEKPHQISFWGHTCDILLPCVTYSFRVFVKLFWQTALNFRRNWRSELGLHSRNLNLKSGLWIWSGENISVKAISEGVVGFSVLRIWPIFGSVFRFSHQKTAGFLDLVSFAVCRFSPI